MKKLTIRAYMSPAPHTIGADQPLSVAAEIMRANKIRHLPVLSDGELVGLLSDRDLSLVAGSAGLKTVVEEAMSPEVFKLSPDTSLEWVALEMAQHKYGSTVVVEHDKVVGVFTTVDALRALQDLLAETRRNKSHKKVA